MTVYVVFMSLHTSVFNDCSLTDSDYFLSTYPFMVTVEALIIIN